MEVGMVEYETPIDRFLAPAQTAKAEVIEQRAQLIARGDFNNPFDQALDRTGVRNTIARRILGRG
jgi:hypothetical protein